MNAQAAYLVNNLASSGDIKRLLGCMALYWGRFRFLPVDRARERESEWYSWKIFLHFPPTELASNAATFIECAYIFMYFYASRSINIKRRKKSLLHFISFLQSRLQKSIDLCSLSRWLPVSLFFGIRAVDCRLFVCAFAFYLLPMFFKPRQYLSAARFRSYAHWKISKLLRPESSGKSVPVISACFFFARALLLRPGEICHFTALTFSWP